MSPMPSVIWPADVNAYSYSLKSFRGGNWSQNNPIAAFGSQVSGDRSDFFIFAYGETENAAGQSPSGFYWNKIDIVVHQQWLQG